MAPMTARVLAFLRRYGSISNLEAHDRLQCRSVSRRICDLKELGYDITTERKRDKFGQPYVRYHLARASRAA